MMGKIKILLLLVILSVPMVAGADASSVPGGANWYFYVDLEQMRSGGPGAPMYDWLRNEVLETPAGAEAVGTHVKPLGLMRRSGRLRQEATV